MAVLVTAASRYGSTDGIARAIAGTLAERGTPTVVLPPGQVGDIGRYDAVVLGSAVYTGHWLPAALALADRGRGAWSGRPVWLFSSGPVGDPARPLTRKMDVDPVDLPRVRELTGARDHRMFPGRLDRRNLPLAQRLALSVVRGLEGDFRDWDAVRAWSAGIADALHETTAR